MSRQKRIKDFLSSINPLDETNRRNFSSAAADAFGEGREDSTKATYKAREARGDDADDVRIGQTFATNPTFYRTREALGIADPQHVQTRTEMGMGPKDTMAGKLGQMTGTIGADLTQDNTRSLWWLLNAAQATGNVINEAALKAANKDLYGASIVKNQYGKDIRVGKDPLQNQDALNAGLIDPDSGSMRKGVGVKSVTDDQGRKRKYYTKRNFEPGHVAALGIPTGIAINTGLGLLTPFGGAEGYKAALPSEEDPTKTDNVLGEVALKYFMGRTGNLLPYEEFSKARPDVSREEYGKYQAWKYDKDEDWNPFDDGDVSMMAGALRATDEGIHGPEIQFLGRSLPVTTGVVPYLGALAGGAAGVRTSRPIRGGFGGGIAGLAVGQVVGNLVENERRRRNATENQLENPQPLIN